MLSGAWGIGLSGTASDGSRTRLLFSRLILSARGYFRALEGLSQGQYGGRPFPHTSFRYQVRNKHSR